MKINDIQVGQQYEVKVGQDVDSTVWHYGGQVTATVVRVGVSRQVPKKMTLHGIKGSPRITTGHYEAENQDGVEIVWATQGGIDRFNHVHTSDTAIPAGRAVIAAKCVMNPAGEVSVGGYKSKKVADERLEQVKEDCPSAHMLKVSGYWTVFAKAEEVYA